MLGKMLLCLEYETLKHVLFPYVKNVGGQCTLLQLHIMYPFNEQDAFQITYEWTYGT